MISEDLRAVLLIMSIVEIMAIAVLGLCVAVVVWRALHAVPTMSARRFTWDVICESIAWMLIAGSAMPMLSPLGRWLLIIMALACVILAYALRLSAWKSLAEQLRERRVIRAVIYAEQERKRREKAETTVDQ